MEAPKRKEVKEVEPVIHEQDLYDYDNGMYCGVLVTKKSNEKTG